MAPKSYHLTICPSGFMSERNDWWVARNNVLYVFHLLVNVEKKKKKFWTCRKETTVLGRNTIPSTLSFTSWKPLQLERTPTGGSDFRFTSSCIFSSSPFYFFSPFSPTPVSLFLILIIHFLFQRNNTPPPQERTIWVKTKGHRRHVFCGLETLHNEERK